MYNFIGDLVQDIHTGGWGIDQIEKICRTAATINNVDWRELKRKVEAAYAARFIYGA